jgi:hypothetical protein
MATLVVRNTRSTNKKAAAAASGADTPDDSVAGVSLPLVTSDAYKEAVEDYKLSIHEYKLDLDEFEKQDGRLRMAKGLLSMSRYDS